MLQTCTHTHFKHMKTSDITHAYIYTLKTCIHHTHTTRVYITQKLYKHVHIRHTGNTSHTGNKCILYIHTANMHTYHIHTANTCTHHAHTANTQTCTHHTLQTCKHMYALYTHTHTHKLQTNVCITHATSENT